MRMLRILLRAAGFVVGATAVVWGCVIAAVANQPIPLIVAGVLVLLVSWVGDGWEEIALRFGDSEARVKRAVAQKVSEGLEAVTKVEQVAVAAEGLSPVAREVIAKTADTARERIAADDGVWAVAAQRAYARSGPVVLGAVEPRLKLGEPSPKGKRRVDVVGVDDSDWTEELEIELRYGDRTSRVSVGEGAHIFAYPGDWGLSEVPDEAELVLGYRNIYMPEKFEFELDRKQLTRRQPPQQASE